MLISALIGGLVGGRLGFLVGLGTLNIPGMSPVVAAGSLATSRNIASVGALIGVLIGGLLGLIILWSMTLRQRNR